MSVRTWMVRLDLGHSHYAAKAKQTYHEREALLSHNHLDIADNTHIGYIPTFFIDRF